MCATFAVPTFFVINGFYVVPAMRDRHSFGRWWRRMFGVYVFWQTVYAPIFLADHLARWHCRPRP